MWMRYIHPMMNSRMRFIIMLQTVYALPVNLASSVSGAMSKPHFHAKVGQESKWKSAKLCGLCKGAAALCLKMTS
jgi:hypothetical protein